MVERFEDEGRRPFAHQEAVAVLVEGTGGVFGATPVPGGQGGHHIHARHRKRMDCRLRRARDHDIRRAAPVLYRRFAEGIRAGGAGGCQRHIGSARANADGEIPRRAV